jgi:ATP-dependent Clp protease ATP-binding subunit ClpB
VVEEPTVEQTITILRGLKPRYSSHHGVEIADSALVAAARYSDRYITDRFLPDKAIDLIDEAASALRLQLESKPDELEALERRLITLQIELESLRNDKDAISIERRESIQDSIKTTENQAREMEKLWREEKDKMLSVKETRMQLEQAKQDYQDAKLKGEWAKAAELEYATIPMLEVSQVCRMSTGSADRLFRLLQAKLPREADVEAGGNTNTAAPFLHDRVSADDVARVISKVTGVPLKSLLLGERERLLRLEEELSQSIVGQSEAVHSVAAAVRLSRAGLSSPNRPLASFLMLGPTGVGKTELSKKLARFLFDSERALVTINMSEYSERHTVARLIGAP